MDDMNQKRGMSGVVVFLLIILFAAIAGGGTYYYFNNKFEKDKKDLNNQITDLNKKLTDAKKETTATTSTSSTTATTTTDETADWKTYTNSKYLFSIKYPTDWTVAESSEKQTAESTTKTDSVHFTQNGKTYQIEGSDLSPINISFKTSGGRTGFEIATTDKTATTTGEEKVTKVTVGSIEAGRLVNYLQTTTYLINGNNAVLVSLPNFGDDATNNPLSLIYEKMLKTFQFTK